MMKARERHDEHIRVLVVDDYTLIRNGLRVSLAPYADIEVTGEASSGPLAVAATAELHPDVVLMDLRMPDGDGITATRQIVAGDSGAAVVVLTTFEGDRDVHDAIDAGATSYLLKDIDPPDLARAVRAAAAGNSVINERVLPGLLADYRRRGGHDSHDPNPLNAREKLIVRALAQGKTNREIAKELTMSHGGVKSAVERLLSKYGLASRAELAAWATSEGLLD